MVVKKIKKTYFKLIPLLILLLGFLVGIVLVTQKKTNPINSEAADSCARSGESCATKECCPGLEEGFNHGIASSCRCYKKITCDKNSDSDRYGYCVGNKAKYCTNLGVWTTIDCSKKGKICGPGNLHVGCSGTPPYPTYQPSARPNPSSNPSSQPIITCAEDCVTRYECSEGNGVQINGKCATGEVCCRF